MPHSGVVVRADRSGGVAILCGATDIGQGSDSILAYLPAEVLGHRAQGRPRPPGRHEPDARRSRLVLVAGDAHVRHGGDPGGRAPARARSSRPSAQKLEVGPAAAGRSASARWAWPTTGTRRVPFAQAVELGEAMHGVLAFPGSYAPPKRAGKYKGGGVGPSPCYSYSACVVELTVDEDTGRDRARRRVDRPRRRPRAESAAGRGAGRRLGVHGHRRGAHGGAGLPQGPAQAALDAGVQEPDHARDAGDPHHSRGDRRSRGPVRRQGGGAGAAAAR